MHYVLCYPIRNVRGKTEVLLGFMKEGHWKGYFNGFGGKILQESPLQCALRELKEESGMKAKPIDTTYRGHVLFEQVVPKVRTHRIPSQRMNSGVLIDVFTVFVDKKMNEKYKQKSTDVAIPCWFDIKNLPFEMMPAFDSIWIHSMLKHSNNPPLRNYNIKLDNNEPVSYECTEVDRGCGFNLR